MATSASERLQRVAEGGYRMDSFGNGVSKDIDAIRNAIEQPWSSGQVEGQINKLKMVKRQMYGRAKIDLFQARLVGPS
ncbi:transposase [Rhizobium ruizarguesonis]|uniref:transposase n=1 Tax=Rhizobium ruizarguesonis TaxID=2081791 RepID=UPI0013EEB068